MSFYVKLNEVSQLFPRFLDSFCVITLTKAFWLAEEHFVFYGVYALPEQVLMEPFEVVDDILK